MKKLSRQQRKDRAARRIRAQQRYNEERIAQQVADRLNPPYASAARILRRFDLVNNQRLSRIDMLWGYGILQPDLSVKVGSEPMIAISTVHDPESFNVKEKE